MDLTSNDTRARRISQLVGALLFGFLSVGCAVVAPYERERLARSDMALGRDPDLSAGEGHAEAYREGSSGATGQSGGGCGCN